MSELSDVLLKLVFEGKQVSVRSSTTPSICLSTLGPAPAEILVTVHGRSRWGAEHGCYRPVRIDPRDPQADIAAALESCAVEVDEWGAAAAELRNRAP